MLKKSDLTIQKNTQGAYVISAFLNGYLVSHQFHYYTKKEAIRLFLEQQEGKK